MKRFFYYYLALFLMLSFTNCKKEISVNIKGSNTQLRVASSEDTSLINYYKDVGNLHNAGLDYVFSKIAPKTSFYSSIENQTQRVDTILSDIQLFSTQFADSVAESCGGVRDSCLNITSLKDVIIHGFLNTSISDTLRNLVDSVQAYYSSTSTYEDFFSASESVLFNNISDLNSVEKMRFVAGVRIVQSSWLYWDTEENYNKWRVFYENVGFNIENKPNGHSTVMSDLVGGVVGGVRTAFALSECGPGGAIAGFLFGSVAYGIESSAGGYLSGWF